MDIKKFVVKGTKDISLKFNKPTCFFCSVFDMILKVVPDVCTSYSVLTLMHMPSEKRL